jgi:uncharacterized protein
MSASRAAAHLDPRGPLVLDTRDLGRRPGSMRRVNREIAAPVGWGLDLVRVPEGAPVTLELRLEAVMDGVLVSGTVTAEVAAECGRCLEPVRDEVQVDLQELFVYEPTEDGDEPTLVGDFLDLEPLVRDAVVLGLPLNPVCDDECAGLCPGCGARVADLEPDHAHDTPDPRWAALSALPTAPPEKEN